MPVTDFLSWLQREYLNRRKKNENYSIRAFSRFLGISAATVSHLLSGKRVPSEKFIKKLFLKLEATPAEQKNILKNIIKKDVSTEEQSYQMIAMDSFKILSDWYHYAILEMVDVKDFQYDYSWISNQLNISVTEARQAVERLLRLDLLKEEKNKLVKTSGFVTNGDEFITSAAHKKLQRHILEKALNAIDTVSQEEKDISSMTMAIDETKLPEARKLVKKFRRELCQFLENGKQTRVYNLGIQIYPVSKGTKK